ncbi:MAG: threonine/serine dehydratase, partial [Chloroflexota bacterium]
RGVIALSARGHAKATLMAVRLDDVQAAQHVIGEILTPTPLLPAPALGPDVWLKLENVNLTGSFKIRGALNAVANLDMDAEARGVIAASSGNHAQGLAYAANSRQVSAKIVMPRATPQRKIDGVTRYGAEAVVVDGDYDHAEATARKLAVDEGRTFVSAYNDPHVIAGQGTIALEILEQTRTNGVEDTNLRVLVCVSGGGLIAGIALALKALRPDIEVIGVGAERSPAMYNRFHGTARPANEDTLAEALAGDIEDGCITVPIVKEHVDDIVLVSEADIAEAMRWAVLHGGFVAEGGGAVCLAALRSGAVPAEAYGPTVALVSGGNADPATIQRVVCADV